MSATELEPGSDDRPHPRLAALVNGDRYHRAEYHERLSQVSGSIRLIERPGSAPTPRASRLPGGDMAQRTCSIDDCEDPIRNVKHGWCNKHYKSWLRFGDPLKAKRQQWVSYGVPLEQRFWSKVNKNGPVPEHRPDLGPCWIWTGTVAPNGYGRFSMGRKNPGAHRVAYKLLVGPIPEGRELDHRCRVRACVKVIADEHGPAHLEVVTHAENIRRGVGWHTIAEMERAKTHCPQGHPYTEENTYRWRGSSRYCRACARQRNRENRR